MSKAVPYRRQSPTERLFQDAQQDAQTLDAAIKEVFPKADLAALKRWTVRVRAETPVEPELLLFATLLCGVRFQIVRPELAPILESLWGWLTGPPRNMSGEIAELVIEALSPGVQRAIDERGWRQGEDGSFVKKQGAPPVGRGAWTAVLLTEHYLRDAGTKKRVMEFAAGLASALLGRRVEPTQAYRMGRGVTSHSLEELAQLVQKYYEFSVVQNGVRSPDFPLRGDTPDLETGPLSLRGPAMPSRTSIAPRNTPRQVVDVVQRDVVHKLWNAEQRANHRSLAHILANFGGQDWARVILRKIPDSAWEPFWNLQTDKPKKRPKTSA